LVVMYKKDLIWLSPNLSIGKNYYIVYFDFSEARSP